MILGWVKLPRSIEDTGILQNSHCLQVFIMLLIKASHTGHSVFYRGKQCNLSAGETIISIRDLATELNLNRSKVSRCLKTLEQLRLVSLNPQPNGTIVHITNYGENVPAGWVRLPRNLIETGILNDPPCLQIYIWLLLKATHKPRIVS